jgi:hypothetical protein
MSSARYDHCCAKKPYFNARAQVDVDVAFGPSTIYVNQQIQFSVTATSVRPETEYEISASRPLTSIHDFRTNQYATFGC